MIHREIVFGVLDFDAMALPIFSMGRRRWQCIVPRQIYKDLPTHVLGRWGAVLEIIPHFPRSVLIFAKTSQGLIRHGELPVGRYRLT